MKFRVFILLFFVLSFAPSFAQHVGYLGIEDGLSNNTVNTIYKDRFGFMWFGTDDGLNRYDGHGFEVFRNRINDTTSLMLNQINTIAEDHDQNLWVGTKKGINIFSNYASNFSRVYYLPYKKERQELIQANINAIEISENGDKFLATVDQGLLVAGKGEKNFRQVPLSLQDDAFITYSASAVKVDKQGRIWVVAQKLGLCLYNPASGELVQQNGSINNANTIIADNTGALWIAAQNGLYRYDIATNTYKHYNLKVDKRFYITVFDICQVTEDKLWIATDGGGIAILNLKTDQLSFFQSDGGNRSLTSEAVTTLFKDTESRMWIGTLRGGVNIIDRQKDKFRVVANNPLDANSLVDNFAFSFCEDADSSVWIGTDGGGISWWNRRNNSFKNFRFREDDPTALSNNNVTSIIRDHHNTIWVATYGGGINRYDRETGAFKKYTCGNDNTVWKLYEDSSNNLWAGTCTNGALYRYNSAEDKFELFDEELKNVITITEDKAGALWVGTFSKLVKVDRVNKKHRYFVLNHSVRTIRQDRDNNYWIGTQGLGLLNFNTQTGTFKAFTEAEGLTNNSVHTIEEDDRGNFWISTYNGVSKFNPYTKEFKNFYGTDGLQSNQFNYNASLRLSTGEMLMGGIKGFNIFHPDSIASSGSFPKLVFTGVYLFHKPLFAEDDIQTKGNSLYELTDITLPYDKTFITFDFSALEFTSPNKIKYAYFLEGWDKSWNHVKNQHTANYSRLEEGSYRLRIKSTNTEGAWNTAELVVNLKVLPPWYRTWWAYCTCGCLIIGLLYLYTLYHARQAHLKYEARIASIKAGEKADLNERQLSFFTNVSHEFRTPLTLIINPIKELVDQKRKHMDFQDLSIIYRNARRLLSLVDQLLLFRKAEGGQEKLKLCRLNIAKLCENVFLSFSHQAKTKNIAYNFKCDNKSLLLYGDWEKLEIVLFNLLSNSFKFTPASGAVTLGIYDKNGQVEIVIEDTGCGIPTDTGNKLFDKFHQVDSLASASEVGFGIGLYLVKVFVERHHGSISYESELNKGTRFSVLLPADHPECASGTIVETNPESHCLLEELLGSMVEEAHGASAASVTDSLEELVSGGHTMLLVEDNAQIRNYIKQIFTGSFTVYEADNGLTGLEMAQEYLPDIVISDVMVPGMSGLELCTEIKGNVSTSHIPVILLTASTSPEAKLKGIEGGADDYITKPFEKAILTARVSTILKSHNNLQRFFYNEITLKSNTLRISEEYSDFLAACIETIENHLDDPAFNIKSFAREMGMSHSTLYKKVKLISGRSVNDFVRFIRLRQVAKLLIDTDCKVNEAAFQAGFNDMKYFREQFCKLFGVNPSEYIKKYRKPFHKTYTLNERVLKPVE